MIGNKIADKITSLGKPKEKTKKVEEIYIPPEKKTTNKWRPYIVLNIKCNFTV